MMPSVPNPQLLQTELEKLRGEAMAEGLYKVSPGRRAGYLTELAAFLIGAFILLNAGGYATGTGLLLLVLFYQRAAFAGHDIAHGQWFGQGTAATRRAAIMLGILQGFGARWWTEKHDLHHAYPNGYRKRPEGMPEPVDGDIDTAPWLIWDRALHTPATAQGQSWLVRWQAHLLFPLLALTRINWSQQGFRQALVQRNFAEATCIFAHWVAGFTFAGWLAPGSAWVGWLWFLVAQLLGGLILGGVFILNHTGMEIYDAATIDDFFERQTRATRNTPTGALPDWITGGLNSHIEHHIFPGLPRHNLNKVRKRVCQIMRGSGFDYASLTNRAAIATVFSTLKEAAKA